MLITLLIIYPPQSIETTMKANQKNRLPTPREIHPSHSPSKLNNNEYRVPSKLRMRSQKNDTQNVVEVHAVRGFQRYVVHKRKHKSRVPDRIVDRSALTPQHTSEVPSQLHVPESTPSHPLAAIPMMTRIRIRVPKAHATRFFTKYVPLWFPLSRLHCILRDMYFLFLLFAIKPITGFRVV